MLQSYAYCILNSNKLFCQILNPASHCSVWRNQEKPEQIVWGSLSGQVYCLPLVKKHLVLITWIRTVCTMAALWLVCHSNFTVELSSGTSLLLLSWFADLLFEWHWKAMDQAAIDAFFFIQFICLCILSDIFCLSCLCSSAIFIIAETPSSIFLK